MRIAVFVLLMTSAAFADTIHLTNGGKLEGVVLKETDTQVVIRLKYATVTLAKSDIASIEKAKPDVAAASSQRLARWDKCVEVVAARPWADQLRQIPATVIDKGILKNVPYMSHKSGDYEFNLYGDPDHPASLEIGVTKELLKSDAAKKECLAVMLALVADEKDQAVLKSLDVAKDKKEREGLTFEVTPETAEDAYGGWWITVYDPKALDVARATEEELKAITKAEEEIEKEEEEERKKEEEEKKREEEEKKKGKEPKAKPKPTQDVIVLGISKWNKKDMKMARPRVQVKVRRVYVRGYHRSGGVYVGPIWKK